MVFNPFSVQTETNSMEACPACRVLPLLLANTFAGVWRGVHSDD